MRGQRAARRREPPRDGALAPRRIWRRYRELAAAERRSTVGSEKENGQSRKAARCQWADERARRAGWGRHRKNALANQLTLSRWRHQPAPCHKQNISERSRTSRNRATSLPAQSGGGQLFDLGGQSGSQPFRLIPAGSRAPGDRARRPANSIHSSLCGAI